MLRIDNGVPVPSSPESALLIARLTYFVMASGVAAFFTMLADRCGWSDWLHGTVEAELAKTKRDQNPR